MWHITIRPLCWTVFLQSPEVSHENSVLELSFVTSLLTSLHFPNGLTAQALSEINSEHGPLYRVCGGVVVVYIYSC